MRPLEEEQLDFMATPVSLQSRNRHPSDQRVRWGCACNAQNRTSAPSTRSRMNRWTDHPGISLMATT